MFEGHAEEAMKHYAALIPDTRITRLDRWGPAGPGKEGTVYHGVISIAGRDFRTFDSPAPHGFTFTPSVSIYLDCADEAELERIYAGLLEGGAALMPIGAYGFSRRFGWVNDRFGVSWQINLP